MRVKVAVGLLAILLSAVAPASGLPRREPNSPDFTISIKGRPLLESFQDTTKFKTSRGWDFGDRSAYSCAWAQFFEGSKRLFEIHYEVVRDGYDFPIQINDRNGAEAPDGTIEARCGDGVGPGPSARWDGSDHFPHGTALKFRYRGKKIATVGYRRPECSKTYWTPGNQPGEAWLWWDQDGPTSDGHHSLMCAGGPADPVPVVRAYTKHRAPGVRVCTKDSLSGDLCSRRR